jgi:hypothetical protein
MNKLVFGALIAGVVSQAAGCIISSDDSGNDAHITANWSILTTASSGHGGGAVAPCPPGFDTAALYNQEIDANGSTIGQPIIDLFNCDAGTGTSAPLAPTTYLSWIEIANHDNSSQYAKSVGAEVDITNSDKTFSAQILTDGGYFQVAWNLQSAGGSPLLCADVVGIAGVESISTEVGNAQNFASDIFNCEDHEGITSGFVAANYTVHVDAINNAQPPASIGDAPDLTNKVITAPNKVTDLGTVTIIMN